MSGDRDNAGLAALLAGQIHLRALLAIEEQFPDEANRSAAAAVLYGTFAAMWEMVRDELASPALIMLFEASKAATLGLIDETGETLQ